MASSGSARSLSEAMVAAGRAERGITLDGLEWLREEALAAGDLRKLALPGLREDRLPVFPGGLAIMSAVFAELSLKQMTIAEGALRQGVLWDLLGRVHHRDIREVTVDQFARRYHVDPVQSQRVGTLARNLYRQLEPVRDEKDARAEAFLEWAARLHEIGITIAQGAYHKHTAYILANADMPGFSRQEQGWLSNLVLSQRGRLSKMRAAFEDDASLATRRAVPAPRGDLLPQPADAAAAAAAHRKEGARASASRWTASGSRRTRSWPSRWRRSASEWASVGLGFESFEAF